jgi:RNA polymerase sigma factor (sigma-70 family)
VWRIVRRTVLEQRRNGREVTLDDAASVALVMPERKPALARALATLTPRRRLIVFLRYFADLSYAEIAESCSISEGTVAATLAQARAALQAELEREESI